jgi:hypothetical protein
MSLIKELKARETEIVKVKDIIDNNYGVIQKYSNDLERQHSLELDKYVKKVKRILERIREGELENYSDEYLEYHIIAFPTILYEIVESLEDLGSKQDISKLHREEKYSEVYSSILEGTIPDKENTAKRQVMAETVIMEIYKRAYNKLKKKFDVAMELHASLKKALDHRIKNKEVFRRDNIVPDIRGEVSEED